MKLTDAEWKILELLWEKGPLSTMDIIRELEGSVGWAKSTVITVLNRMTSKESIYYKMDGKSKIYYPSTEREQAGLDEVQNFSKRFFGGDLGLMICSLVKNEKLSQAELDEINKIINGEE